MKLNGSTFNLILFFFSFDFQFFFFFAQQSSIYPLWLVSFKEDLFYLFDVYAPAPSVIAKTFKVLHQFQATISDGLSFIRPSRPKDIKIPNGRR